MKFVHVDHVRSWLSEAPTLSEYTRSLGRTRADIDYVRRVIGIPQHLHFIIEEMSRETGQDVPLDAFDSIPFYSLCRGLFLPLSSMAPEKVAHLFGIAVEPPPNTAGREELLVRFFQKDLGLSLPMKLACVLGDPFMGKPSTFRRNSLMRLLGTVRMVTRNQLLDKLTMAGEVAALYAESRPNLREDPPLTAGEVLTTLRFLPPQKRNFKFGILRSLFDRCGKLEAYFLAKLMLRKAGFGFDYQGPLLARTLAEQFGAQPEQVAQAMALTDAFRVAEVLAEEGVAGLKKIQLQPLVPVRPALASGTADQIKAFPVWVERKYDGIRLMLHKGTDTKGFALAGAYTRTRRDWLELVLNMDVTIKSLPVQSAIVDGELYGTMFDLDGMRPASVYEVYGALQGDPAATRINLKYAAFDILYLNGQDLTPMPLSQRRQHLEMVVAPLANFQLPIPIKLAEGQLAAGPEDINRLYHHFRAQGYEGIITKDLNGQYLLARRDPAWMKRKPVITLDLVLLGAVYAVTTKEKAGLFGSYVIGAKTSDGTLVPVGDVAGIDRVRDAEIQGEIMREGLITGNRIERDSSSGVRPGIELKPHIVVTVKFEGIVRDMTTKQLSLRDPKLVVIRADKTPFEADSQEAIEEIYLKQRFG